MDLENEYLASMGIVYGIYRYLISVDACLGERLTQEMKPLNIDMTSESHVELLEEAYKLAVENHRKSVSKNTDNIYRLKSLFSEIYTKKKDDMKNRDRKEYMNLQPLEMSRFSLFPTNEAIIPRDEFQSYIDCFLQDLKVYKSNKQLYYLLQKYFCNLPFINVRDCSVSAFDIAKLTGALSVNLMQDHDRMLLIKGDVSGIQDFIFDVSSKGAAKSLKGRSVYMNLLSEIICKHMIREMKLSLCNILYSGGGNFYLLAPGSYKKELEQIRERVLKTLLKAHKGKIYIAIGSHIFSNSDFNRYSDVWTGAGEAASILKSKRWNEIGLVENYRHIFGPLDEGTEYDDVCQVCGTVAGELTQGGLCSQCHSFVNMTTALKKSRYYGELEIQPKNNEIYQSADDVFEALGFRIKFSEEYIEGYNNYLINDTAFIEKDCQGYLFKALNLPEGTFHEIAQNDEAVEGDRKLGLLKLDVDNLGKIFINGLGETGSIAKTMGLSRMLSLFFEGYLQTLINKDEEKQFLENRLTGKDWHTRLYVVFSGGDDTFIVGAYHEVFEFAYLLRQAFHKYVCDNQEISFSAGLGLFSTKYPVLRAAQHTEEALEMAKSYIRQGDVLPHKDSVCLFGEVFSWYEYEKILDIRRLCQEIVEKSKNRAVLNKVLQSTRGFKGIMSSVDKKSHLSALKVHRLAYFLRDLKNHKRQDIKERVEELINVYEEMTVKVLLGKDSSYSDIANIMLIPAAVRWAELNTKKIKESGERR